MKVVFLMQDIRIFYGAEWAMFCLVEGLAVAGTDVRILLLRETRLGAHASPLAEAFRQRLPVTEIDMPGRFSRQAARAIRDFVRREKVDVLHSTGYKADWHAYWAAKRGALFPTVSTVHGWLFRWNWKERLFQVLNLRALRHFSRVIVLSDFYERYLRRHGLHPLQLARIPTGIQPDEVASEEMAAQLYATPDAVFTFGMLGRLSHEKEHGLMLDAAVQLERHLATSPRSWRVLVAGDGPLRVQLQRQIERRGLQGRVILAGPMAAADFFQQVHVLVQCSRVENQPMSIMEAMAWMRSTIATRAGGMPEMIADGVSGWLVPKGNARALAAAMREALAAPEMARRAGQIARRALARNYPFGPMIAEHQGLYDAAVQMFGGRRRAEAEATF